MCYTTYDGHFIDYGEDDEREDYAADASGTEPMREPCPECSEPAVASWDHLEECPYFEEMHDLPF